MNRIVLLICGVFLAIQLQAQLSPLGNEWINYDQQYYKIKTAADGLYRIHRQELLDAGINLSELDPREIEIYHRGEEVAFFSSGLEDQSFDASDYIEFFGIKNDGKNEELLYESSLRHTHPEFSIYTDTTAFFLTWNNDGVFPAQAQESARRDFGNVNLENEWLVEADTNFHSRYYTGEKLILSDIITASTFGGGEGWGYEFARDGSPRHVSMNLGGQIIGGSQLDINFRLIGVSATVHNVEIYVGPDLNNLRLASTVNFDFFDVLNASLTILDSDISLSGELFFQVAPIDNGSLDQVSLNRLELRYNTTTSSLNSRNSIIIEAGTAENYFQISDWQLNNYLLDISDYRKPISYLPQVNNNQADIIIEGGVDERVIFLGNQIFTPSLEQVTFQNISPSNNDFMIIGARELDEVAGSGENPIQEYRNYRASGEGGSRQVTLVYMDEIVDQFNYGEVGPLGIYRFVNFMSQQDLPNDLFLIGKALLPAVNLRGNYYRDGPIAGFKDLVPTAGWPGSDDAYAAPNYGFDYVPGFAVGRLSVTNGSQVMSYLDKVREHEALPFSELWRKRVLHLSGGLQPDEQIEFRQLVDVLKAIIVDVSLGAEVKTIQKNTTETREIIDVSKEVNEGLSLITFLGHSNVDIIDIDIGKIDDPAFGYQNKGKYPAILVNGCRTGDIYGAFENLGENWVNATDRGAINYMAHSSYAVEIYLFRFSNLLYESAFGRDSPGGQSIGQSRVIAFQQYDSLYSRLGYINKSMLQQIPLMGDPSIKLVPPVASDYQFDSDNWSFNSLDGSPLTAQSSDIELEFIVQNTGKAIDDSIRVQITRSLADGTTIQYDSLYPPVYYSDTLSFIIPNDQNRDNSGLNRFSVFVDSDFAFSEIDENNNLLDLELELSRGRILHVFPENYGIVSNSNLNLVVQNTDILDLNSPLQVELDTTPFFNSPFRMTWERTGGVIFNLPIDLSALSDSTVLYWRSALSETGSIFWNRTSFTYINGAEPGWSQSDFYQFTENQMSGFAVDSLNKVFLFEESSTDLDLTNFYFKSGFTASQVSVQINAIEYNIVNIISNCRIRTLNFIAFDRNTSLPYAAEPYVFISGQSANKTCGRQPPVINSYSFTDAVNSRIENYVDLVDDGDSVFFYTIPPYRYADLPASTYSRLAELGLNITEFTSIPNNEPAAFLGAKGADPNSAKVFRMNADSVLVYSGSILGRRDTASLRVNSIGPVESWGSFTHNEENPSFGSADQYAYQIDQLLNGESLAFTQGELLGTTDLSQLDANTPLSLVFSASDTVDLSPLQPKRMTVNYQPLPEGILKTSIINEERVLVEGDSLVFPFQFINISNKSFIDSLRVDWSIRNSQLGLRNFAFNILAPEPGDTSSFSIEMSSVNLIGDNDFSMQVNNRIIPERNYINNAVQIKSAFRVKPDFRRPLIEVKVDNRRILSGEIVSPSPYLNIELLNENRLIDLSDTTLLRISLHSQNGNDDPIRLFYSSVNTDWRYSEEDSKLYFNHQVQNLADGIYELRIEQNTDNGGSSALEDYTLEFEVINESTISRFYPYPNPFSDKMRFVFTLTGSTLPEDINIRILTISGRLIREIRMDELGPIHIGNNISSFHWDGTDRFGNKLANGVYLYEVRVRQGDELMKLRQNLNDRGFKNGIGKIYIAR